MSRPITQQLLSNLFTGFKTSFRSGFAGVTPAWSQVATLVPSSARTEKYSWLGAWPKIREWIGDRHVKQLAGHSYEVTNRRFESTISVNADDIKDDQLGIYGPMFQELGRATGAFPDELIFGLLARGHQAKCYDGQNFFDAEHPMGKAVVSNITDGASAPWYLLDTSRALKPLIYQKREDFDLVGLDNPNDPNVFWKNEFVYGTTGRAEAGFGFWQMAHRSKATLNAAGFKAARTAMGSLKDDEDKPLGVRGRLLVVPPSLEGEARELLQAERNAAGASNIWRGTAELLVADFLS
ncbi:Mu-like prophage major head subunit gpT family protein [Phenylobacterium sp.]|uniref:Mu-like prophage major head subunit gpT family protein n=1 Tax=Phenylobacterium sp. TaxID=1871053 RepID=UPI0027318FBC|nr:Mu-like prophage major head subunit gpT family protein [Phenylobacterium sp.]MDP1617337.1 Mu-like prophage major head subunit gpT family protein [Phenylobacterium sp.]MDP1985709.1 Mu-like prophage major head subunit gpT family protein [Phenylobacterium sp.]